MKVLGIDIGGSGIKAAIVDTETGQFISERHRIPTPQPATPEAVSQTIKEMLVHFNWKERAGCGFPTPFHSNKCLSGGNLHDSWKDVNVSQLFNKTTGVDFSVVNDADAAGLAEVRYGAGKDAKGTVILITIGTGIGSAVFLNTKLLPNTELGHVFYKKDMVFEKYAADSIRKKEDLSYKQWGRRLNKYFLNIELILSPDLIILGGGVSKKLDRFIDEIKISTPIVAAHSLNNAGIIGAALAAVD